MTTIGTATTTGPQQASSELRVFDGQGAVVLTFLNSAVIGYTVEDSASKIPYAEGELSIPGAFPLSVLARGAPIELWVLRATRPDHRMFRGNLEYVETSSEGGGPTKVIFQARGVAAVLLDAPFTGELGHTVDAVVAGLVGGAGLRAATDYPETELSAWVNTQSSYGALRLLATNLDAVVRTQDDLIEFLSSSAHLARAGARPTFKLTRDQIQSSRTVQGQRVKK